MSKLISVIMSVYNETEEELTKSINSILNQTYNNFEFIIIYDNPENKIKYEFLKSFLNDKRVILLKNDTNKGLVYSLNRGIDLSKGNYIARMDADDISYKNRFEKQIEFLLNNNLDIIGGNIEFIDEQDNFLRKGLVISDLKLLKKISPYLTSLAHPTYFGKKEVFFNLKYRDIPFVEDKDFILRGIYSGYKFSNIQDIVLKYRVRKNSISNKNLYIQTIKNLYLKKSFFRSKTLKEYIKNTKNIEKDISNFINEKRQNNYLLSKKYLFLSYEKYKQKKFFLCFFYLLKSIFKEKIIIYNIICKYKLVFYKKIEAKSWV